MHFDHSIVSRYFPNLSADQQTQFKELGELYAYWNTRINLISRKDFEHLYLHHILHSLGIAKLIQFEPETSVLDIGTGGGFPGIPLAIMFPKVRFHLVDSIKKKIKVVRAVSSSLNLTNVEADSLRVDELNGKYDFAVGRAVTKVATIQDWIEDTIQPESRNSLGNGLIYFKGAGDPELETPGVTSFPLGNYFSEDFFETKLIIHLPSFFSLSQKNLN
jgi:16S rRNA (guanine527-N7)-methyltransferase